MKHKPTNVGRISLERQAGRKLFDGFESLTSRCLNKCTAHWAIKHFLFVGCNQFILAASFISK